METKSNKILEYYVKKIEIYQQLSKELKNYQKKWKMINLTTIYNKLNKILIKISIQIEVNQALNSIV